MNSETYLETLILSWKLHFEPENIEIKLETPISTLKYHFQLEKFIIDLKTSEFFAKQNDVSKLTIMFPGE